MSNNAANVVAAVAGSHDLPDRGSALSTHSSNQLGKDELKEVALTEVPKKPASAYITVSLLCLCVAFGGFIFGWDTGTISGFVNQSDFIDRFGQTRQSTNERYLSDDRTGLIVSIFNIGCAIGGIILSKLGDMYGRRIGLMCVTMIYIVGIVIQISSSHKWIQYFFGRIISGMGVGGIAVLSPMLISETSPKHLRGTLVSCYQLMITAGIFLGYCTNYGVKSYDNSSQWRVPLGLCFAWAVFMIIGMLLVPESPRYLLENDRVDEARRSLARSNKVSEDEPSIQHEMDLIMGGIEVERMAGTATFGELFSTKSKVLQRLVMGVLIQSLQQLTGNNYFFYYGTTVFKSVGMDDSFVTSIILGAVNFASTFVAIYVVGRYGRRKLLLLGAASMAVCMVIFASVGSFKLWENNDPDLEASKSAGNTMIVFTCFYIFCFATTWAPLAYVIVSETFPLRVKAKGMSIATAANWIWGFLISYFTPKITSAIRFKYGYVFFGCLVFSFFYIFFFVPETQGLTLEEVEEMWLEGVLPWKSEGWVPSAQRSGVHDQTV